MSAGVSDTSGCRVTPAAIGCRRRAEIFTRHRCHGRRVRCPRSREEPRGSLAPETAAASRASGRLPAGGATRSPETPECAEQGLRAEVRQQLWGQAGRGSPSFPRTATSQPWTAPQRTFARWRVSVLFIPESPRPGELSRRAC